MGKVSRKDLERLIEGVISERFKPLSSFTQVYQHSLGNTEDRTDNNEDYKNTLEKLSNIKDPANKLNADDLNYFISVPDDEKRERYGKLDTDVERGIYNIIGLPKAYDNLLDKMFKSARSSITAGISFQTNKRKTSSKKPIPQIKEKDREKIKNALKGPKAGEAAARLSSNAPIASPYISDLNNFIQVYQNYQNMQALSTLAQQALNEFYEFQQQVAQAGDGTLTAPKIDSAKAEEGIFPKSQLKMVELLLTADSFSGRMGQVNEISQKYLRASRATDQAGVQKELGTDPSTILTEIALLDMFNLLLRGTTAEMARYGFEALLALIAGGRQAGADLTSSGTQGVADFLDDDKNPGSAKLYKSGTGTIDQSEANFKEAAANSGKPDFFVHYVVGIKKQGEEQLGRDALGRGSGTPSKTVVLEVHEPMIGIDQNGFYFIPSGGTDKVYNSQTPFVSNGRVRIDKSLPLGTATGEIYVTSTRVQTFREYIGTTIDMLDGQAKQMLDFFQRYIEALEESKERSKVYIASKQSDDASLTIQSLNNAQTNFTGIRNVMETYQSSNPQPTSESKITADHLKKLIEESFKK